MKMYRTDKIHPLDIQDLESELFRRKNKEDVKIGKNDSIFMQVLKSIFASTIKQTLEEAKELNDDLCTKREEEMESIVVHRNCSVSWWNLLWGLVGTVLGMAAVFIGFVLWPTENVFLHPDHWYECMLQCGIVWIGSNFFTYIRTSYTMLIPLHFIATCAAFLLANTSAWMNLASMLTMRTYATCYLAGSVGMMSFWCFLYLLWVPILHLPYPIPLVGALNAFAGVTAIIVAIWFKFPRSWRKDSTFRHRAKYLLVAQLFILVMSLEYWLFSWVFFAIPLDLQWILAILLPLTREIGALVLTKICEKIAGRKDESGELVATNLGLGHCYLLAIFNISFIISF